MSSPARLSLVGLLGFLALAGVERPSAEAGRFAAVKRELATSAPAFKARRQARRGDFTASVETLTAQPPSGGRWARRQFARSERKLLSKLRKLSGWTDSPTKLLNGKLALERIAASDSPSVKNIRSEAATLVGPTARKWAWQVHHVLRAEFRRIRLSAGSFR